MPILRRVTSAAPSYDVRFQHAFNGALSDGLRARIGAVKGAHNFTLDELGQRLGFSASFVGNLMKGQKAIRTKHISGLVRQLEALENGIPGLRLVQQTFDPLSSDGREKKSLDEASLEDLTRRANYLGFDVTFTQRPHHAEINPTR